METPDCDHHGYSWSEPPSSWGILRKQQDLHHFERLLEMGRLQPAHRPLLKQNHPTSRISPTSSTFPGRAVGGGVLLNMTNRFTPLPCNLALTPACIQDSVQTARLVIWGI